MSSFNADSLRRKVSTLSSSVGAALAASTNTARQPASSASRTLPRAWRPPSATGGGIDAILSDLIFQAGVDFETRPIVVVCASAFPDPSAVSYDELLHRILSYLDAYVESDYTVVLFTAGSKFQPSWNWIWKAYKSLNRKYRKNLKQMYVVHSSWFFRMLFSLAGNIISPKFFRKIVYVELFHQTFSSFSTSVKISTLSQLAQHVPIKQITIPEEVYEENLKFESSIVLPPTQKTKVFGVPIETLLAEQEEGDTVPIVVRDCVEYLRSAGLTTQGLFRRSPSSATLNQAVKAYDEGRPVSLAAYNDPHIAAVLLKKYLRDLPNPIFSEALYDRIRGCPRSSDVDAQVKWIKKYILPGVSSKPIQDVLNVVVELMHDVALKSDQNLMDAHNLALVLAPNLIKGSNPLKDIEMCAYPPENSAQARAGISTLATILEICISKYPEIFTPLET